MSSKKSPKCKVRLGPGDGHKKLNSALESSEAQNWSFFEPSPRANPEASRNWYCRGRHLDVFHSGLIRGFKMFRVPEDSRTFSAGVLVLPPVQFAGVIGSACGKCTSGSSETV